MTGVMSQEQERVTIWKKQSQRTTAEVSLLCSYTSSVCCQTVSVCCQRPLELAQDNCCSCMLRLLIGQGSLLLLQLMTLSLQLLPLLVHCLYICPQLYMFCRNVALSRQIQLQKRGGTVNSKGIELYQQRLHTGFPATIFACQPLLFLLHVLAQPCTLMLSSLHTRKSQTCARFCFFKFFEVKKQTLM